MQSPGRYSKKREAMLELLQSTTAHPSAEWVYQQMKQTYPDISLGTVYRNLAQFKQQGRIASVGCFNGVERFDATVEPHVHFVCTNCGQVQDLHHLQVPSQLCEDAAKETRATVCQCQLTFTGLCGTCGE